MTKLKTTLYREGGMEQRDRNDIFGQFKIFHLDI